MKAKKSNRTALIVLSTVAVVLVLCIGVGIIGALVGSGDEASNVPAYKVTSQSGGDVVVEVDQLLTKEQMKAIVADLRGKQDKETGYFVSINCSTGATKSSDNRLGNARFAIGALGKARTGLDEGVIDVQVNEGRSCPKS